MLQLQPGPFPPFAHLVHKGSKLAFSEFCWNAILPWKLKQCEGQKAESFSFLADLLPDLLYSWDLSQTIKGQETEANTCSTKSVSTMAVEWEVFYLWGALRCVCGGEWIPLRSHPNCSRSRLQGASTTSAVHIPLLFDTAAFPDSVLQLEYNISPRCCLKLKPSLESMMPQTTIFSRTLIYGNWVSPTQHLS